MIMINISSALGWVKTMAKKAKARKAQAPRIRKLPPTPQQLVAEKAETIGIPHAQIARGMHVIVDVKLDKGERAVTSTTLINRGGTPIARWKAAKLLSVSQVAAIDHCERLWAMLGGKAMVMDLARIPGAGQGDGWAEQQALDDLKRIKCYVPAKYWAVFEDVCRFDQPAGTAASPISTNARSAIDTARVVVMFVADIIAMKERLV